LSAAYPLADSLGSTVALTDAQGRVTQRYRYTAYGTPTVLTLNYQPSALNSGSPYRFLFTGREWLASVGLNDHRNRYYSPGLGRWLTTDPIGFRGGLNLYEYANNSPLIFSDPTGTAAYCQRREKTCAERGGEVIPNWQRMGFSGPTDCANAVYDEALSQQLPPIGQIGLGILMIPLRVIYSGAAAVGIAVQYVSGFNLCNDYTCSLDQILPQYM